jgi:hypothetical protein
MRRLAVLASLALAAAVVLLARRRRGWAPAPVAAAPAAPALPPAPSFVSVPWTLVEAPADTPELRIRPAAAGRVDVQETPTQVFVTVIAGSPAVAAEQDATVVLGRPLGERELIHAPVDPAPAGDTRQ